MVYRLGSPQLELFSTMRWIAYFSNIFKKENPPLRARVVKVVQQATIECPVCKVNYPKEMIYCDICILPLYGSTECIKCRSSIAKRSAFCNICGKEQ